MNELVFIRPSEVSEMIKRITSLPVNCGGVRIGQVQSKKIAGLFQWVRDRKRDGLPLSAVDFTVETLLATVEAMDLQEEDDVEISPPAKLVPGKWTQWCLEFENYLSSVKGKNNTSLAYVI